MKFAIRARVTDEILFEAEIDTATPERDRARVALESAVCARANLTGANLTGANLARANLDGANLTGANLTGANLTGANLDGANLTGAYLARANLARANLDGANLTGAYLARANLARANLTGANLDGANLDGANLDGAKGASLVIARTRILPEGSLVGWKQLRAGVIAQLHIPASAKRSHAFGRKCRAECAEVLALYGSDGKATTKGYSHHDSDFVYEVGAIVVPRDAFSENWTEECASGIHFFITREEAEAYC